LSLIDYSHCPISVETKAIRTIWRNIDLHLDGRWYPRRNDYIDISIYRSIEPTNTNRLRRSKIKRRRWNNTTLQQSTCWRVNGQQLCFPVRRLCLLTGMVPDYLPRVSSKNCGYPFTFLGRLYHSSVEMMENVTGDCERWGCFEVNYTAAFCAANVGKSRTLGSNT